MANILWFYFRSRLNRPNGTYSSETGIPSATSYYGLCAKTAGLTLQVPFCHFYIFLQANSLYLVTITKNPYSFLLSLYDNPHQIIGPRPLTFSDFIKTKWFSQKREKTRKYFESPIDLWNRKNASYVQLKKAFPDCCISLTYENLVRDPEEAIGFISRQFSLSMITPFNNMIVSSKKNGKFFIDYQEYYLQERWRERLAQDDIEFINAKLDFQLLDLYGYSRVQ